jgi:hypothetical protein
MAGKYDQLHIMTNYLTKYENYQTNNLRRVAFTKYNDIDIAWKLLNPTTPTKIIESKWWDDMIN